MKSYKDKQLLVGLVFLGLAAGFLGRGFESLRLSFPGTGNLNQAAAIEATMNNLVGTQNAGTVEEKPRTPPSLTLGFVGDIMMDRGVKASVKKNFAGDYAKLFANAGFLAEPDVMFANLEGPVSLVGSDRQNLYSFRMSPDVIPALKAAGVDVVASANNHINDWNSAALVDTYKRLKAANIATCGIGMNKEEAMLPAVFGKDGYTVGFLCFTDVGPNEAAATATKPGILLASDPDFDTIVKNAASKVDALVVSFHWGDEYKTVHNARQEALAKRAIDAGAALIQGEHPHVAQDIASYKNVSILYSLGNFIFDQAFSAETMRGLYVTATATGKTISDVKSHIITLDKNFAPSLK